eukprot:3104700-Rhodomonas_salina.4
MSSAILLLVGLRMCGTETAYGAARCEEPKEWHKGKKVLGMPRYRPTHSGLCTRYAMSSTDIRGLRCLVLTFTLSYHAMA